jgi:hypothetical protein
MNAFNFLFLFADSEYVMKLLILFLFLASLTSCTKEEFNQSTKNEDQNAEPIRVVVEELCTGFTPPPVDILLLVDNTTSVNLIGPVFKESIRKIVQAASGFNDYRIYIAPLVPEQVSGGQSELAKKEYQLVTNSPSRLPITAQVRGIDDLVVPQATNRITTEKGMSRAIDLLKVNSRISSGSNLLNIFRDNAFTMVILVSNGDDRLITVDNVNNEIVGGQFNDIKNEFLGIKSTLNLLTMRFLTVVNHSQCGASVKRPGEYYKQMSKSIFNNQGLNANLSNGTSTDSYDLCSGDFESIFGSIAEAVENLKRGHIYDRWPISNQLDFDPEKLVIVKKSTGESISRSSTNGFEFIDQPLTNVNIREFPPIEPNAPGEFYSGYFVDLNGSGKVSFPDCLVVRKEDFTKYYGYIVLQDKPNPDTLKVVINGQELANSDQNGWQYIGFQESVNILVKSNTDLSSITPGIFQSGYVIKLFGNAVYEDGAKVEVFFKGAPL